MLLNMLSRLVITFLPRSKRLLISWLQSPSAVICCYIFSPQNQRIYTNTVDFYILKRKNFLKRYLTTRWLKITKSIVTMCPSLSLSKFPLSSSVQFNSVQSLSCVRLFATPWSSAHQASLSITTPRVHPDSHPSSQWCHPAISSSVVPFSSCPQSLPASESFPISQLFPWGGQSTGVSALASFLSKKSQGWSLSEWTGWISLQSKGLSRVFSNTTVQKHQFFGAQSSSQSNSHIHTWQQEKQEVHDIIQVMEFQLTCLRS